MQVENISALPPPMANYNECFKVGPLWDLNAAAWIATAESIEKGHLTLSVLRRADQEFLEFSRFDELGLNRTQAGKGLAERIDASRWRIANDRGEQIQHFGGTLPTRRPVQP